MEETMNAVETVVDNGEVINEVVKKGFELHKAGIYVVAGAVAVGATYVIGKKIYNKVKANKDEAEEEKPEHKIVKLFNKKTTEGPDDVGFCEKEPQGDVK